jgi:hypothetical protein
MSVSTVVLTKEQAHAITRGRTPLVPVEYETAVKALQACMDIDDAKYWSDKADALAAWAKIYHNEDAIRKAKMLKLHAFRRMGEIAGELKPLKNVAGGRAPGSLQLLKNSGLTTNGAVAARRLATITQKQFDKIMDRPKAPTSVVQDLWVRDQGWADFIRTATTFRSALRRHTAAAVAKACKENDRYVVTARELLTEITEWLDEFESKLPKVKK